MNSGQSEGEPTPDLLSCSGQYNFWISWEGGTIALGQHNYPDSQLLQYVPTDASPTTVLGLASGPSSTAEFEFPIQFGNNQLYFLSIVIEVIISQRRSKLDLSTIDIRTSVRFKICQVKETSVQYRGASTYFWPVFF